jgi:hypothetical protein
MRFADSRRSQKNHIAGLVDEPQRAELLNLSLVDGGLKIKIEMPVSSKIISGIPILDPVLAASRSTSSPAQSQSSSLL